MMTRGNMKISKVEKQPKSVLSYDTSEPQGPAWHNSFRRHELYLYLNDNQHISGRN